MKAVEYLLRNIFSKLCSKSNIGTNSSGNIVIQNSTVSGPIMVNCSPESMLMELKNQGDYTAIQTFVSSQLANLKKVHPLYPEFSATVDPKLNRLVSTPEVEDAFKNHPKKIKSTIKVDLKKYPYMHQGEAPWEYAYRTQTEVEVDTTSYQEYLGDEPDPFPLVTFQQGMKTIIKAPEFPPACEASITSGDISIPVKIRRLPNLKYGEILFGNVSTDQGFDFRVSLFENNVKFHFTKRAGADLDTLILMEKLVQNIGTTRSIRIVQGTVEFMRATVSPLECDADIFKNAPLFIQYFESLCTIEKHLNCHLDQMYEDLTVDDYRLAIIMAASLQGNWCREKEAFNDELRVSREHLPHNIHENGGTVHELSGEMQPGTFSLHGKHFRAVKYIVVFSDVKINNLQSVQKNINRKKKLILITLKPANGNEFFWKYSKLEGIELIEE